MVEPDYTLSASIRRCDRCTVMADLRRTDGFNAVPAGVGARTPSRPIAILCEIPSAQEAATSQALAGLGGRTIVELLVEAGISHDEVVVLYRVRCRPPGGKLSNVPEALGNCEEWFDAELTAYDPSVVVVLGGGSMLTQLFGANAKVGQTRGQWRNVNGRAWTVTYSHLSLGYNRSPENRPLVVADLRAAAEVRKAMIAE